MLLLYVWLQMKFINNFQGDLILIAGIGSIYSYARSNHLCAFLDFIMLFENF